MGIWEMIKKSTMFRENKPSSSRIMGYIMMVIILLAGLAAITIELVNAIKTWQKGDMYIIPSEHIVILGMWLAHQLTLLGIYKNSKESSVGSNVKDESVINTIDDTEQIKTNPYKEPDTISECACTRECVCGKRKKRNK